jgi:Fur family transcriptional regulator, peroxide stress response regulator
LPIHKTYPSLSERTDIPEARLRQILTRLKERDFRLTPQRLAILKILAASNGHPSVDKIFDQVKLDFPTTSLATVYKTVTLLKELGEVLELGFPDGGNRYDGNKPYPHPHMVCLKCKKISDPELQSLENLTREAEQKTGFTIFSHRLDFFGLCPHCRHSG